MLLDINRKLISVKEREEGGGWGGGVKEVKGIKSKIIRFKKRRWGETIRRQKNCILLLDINRD